MWFLLQLIILFQILVNNLLAPTPSAGAFKIPRYAETFKYSKYNMA